MLFLIYIPPDMSPKKEAAITDRVTAKKAKAYIYGVKAIRKLAAVKETNIYVAKYMEYKPKDEQTYFFTMNSALTGFFRVTVCVLYLYMLWSFFNT